MDSQGLLSSFLTSFVCRSCWQWGIICCCCFFPPFPQQCAEAKPDVPVARHKRKTLDFPFLLLGFFLRLESYEWIKYDKNVKKEVIVFTIYNKHNWRWENNFKKSVTRNKKKPLTWIISPHVLQRPQSRGPESVVDGNSSRSPSSATCRRYRKVSCWLTISWVAWRSAVRRRAAVQLAATCAITKPWRRQGEACRRQGAMLAASVAAAGVESSLPLSPCCWKSAAWFPSTAWSKTTSPKRWESSRTGSLCVCVWESRLLW